MAFTIYMLTDPVTTPDDKRALTIGIRQDAGTIYKHNVGGIPGTTLTEVRTWLNDNAASLYTEAVARGVTMNLYRDADVKRLVKAYANVNRDRMNAIIASVLNGTSLADVKARLNTAFPRTVQFPNAAIIASTDLQALLDEIDTDPTT